MKQTGKFLNFLFSSRVLNINQLARKPVTFRWSLLFNKAGKWSVGKEEGGGGGWGAAS